MQIESNIAGTHGDPRRGFTLIEIIAALFLAALIMVSVNVFIFSMGSLWGRGEDDRLFERHVNGVARFLQNSVDRAVFVEEAVAGNPENGALAQGEAGEGGIGRPPRSNAYLATVPADRGFGEPRIAFELVESPGILVWPERPLPFVVCYLDFEDQEGLVLLWHSRLEEGFEDEEPRRTLLSPYAGRPVYEYYDPETGRWEEGTALLQRADGEALLPDRIRIPFTYKGREKERLIALTGRGASALSAAMSR